MLTLFAESNSMGITLEEDYQTKMKYLSAEAASKTSHICDLAEAFWPGGGSESEYVAIGP